METILNIVGIIGIIAIAFCLKYKIESLKRKISLLEIQKTELKEKVLHQSESLKLKDNRIELMNENIKTLEKVISIQESLLKDSLEDIRVSFK